MGRDDDAHATYAEHLVDSILSGEDFPRRYGSREGRLRASLVVRVSHWD